MSERPGTGLARRPLHFFFVADCSGSMNADGKIRALNTAIRETLPHLVDVAHQNPHAQLLVRAIAFSDGARWHVERPTEVGELVWDELTAGGYTDLGAALRLLVRELRTDVMPARALPPAIVLVSDGMPTDDWRAGLGELLDEPWGQRSVRMAVGVGRDVDATVLSRFAGEGAPALSAANPEQLVRLIRWASTQAGRAASVLGPAGQTLLPPAQLPDASEVVW